jgi:hypothetical protein
MKPSTWIKKNATCPIIAAEAIELFNTSLVQFQLSSDEIKQSYIKQLKDNLKWSEIFYAEKYVLAAKAFLKYIIK